MANAFNFNSAAVALLNGEPKIRVRTIEGQLQIRPTDRVLGTNLPEGETLRQLNYRPNDAGITIGARATAIGLNLEFGTTYELTEGKYGWLNATPIELNGRASNKAATRIIKG